MTNRRDPINPTDDAARALARDLLEGARFGALATRVDDAPFVSRVAVAAEGGTPLVLASTLAAHTRGLLADPACALLVGEPGPKGDPLTHPRMTVVARAEEAPKAALRDHWLAIHPKAALYFDFADFRLFRLVPEAVHLNGGFGKAYRLTAADLIP